MSLALPPVTLIPGTSIRVQIQSPVQIKAVKISNGSPFDINFSGFGSAGSHWVPAGTEYLIQVQNQQSGVLTLTVVNNYGASGNGICLITEYYVDEPLPQGSWPVSIPQQTVKATSVQNTLVNDGSAPGTQVIEMTETGSTGSNVSVLNDSTVKLQSFVSSVLTPYLVTFPNAISGEAVIQMGDSARDVEVIGNFQADGGIESLGTATFDGTANFNSTMTTGQITNNFNPTFVSGSTGHIQLYLPIWGTGLKIAVLLFFAYTNSSAVTITLPTTFNEGMIFTGSIGNATLQMTSGGTAQSFFCCSTFGTSSQGGGSVESTLSGFSWGLLNTTTVDSFKILAMASSTTTTVVLVGV